jgi:hypothetical protein
MRLIAVLLLLASCNGNVTGGKVTGKRTGIDWGPVKNTVHYYLQLDHEGYVGEIEVTESAWNQANRGMEWPFEVKNNATTSDNQNGK